MGNYSDYLPLLYFSGFVGYIVTSLLLYVVAKKLGSKDAPWAFVPLINFFLFFEIAGVSTIAGVIGLFIPFFNIIIVLVTWSYILKKLGRSDVESLLFFVPGVNAFYILYLIFKYW